MTKIYDWNQRYAHEDPFGNIVSIKPECVYCLHNNPEELEKYDKNVYRCKNKKACITRFDGE